MPHVDKMFERDYLTPELLEGRDATVTIAKVSEEQVQMPGSPKKEGRWVVYFEGKDKGLIVGSTNAHDIARVTGKPRSEDWGGEQITIYPCETMFKGEWVSCIRIRGGRGWCKDRELDGGRDGR